MQHTSLATVLVLLFSTVLAVAPAEQDPVKILKIVFPSDLTRGQADDRGLICDADGDIGSMKLLPLISGLLPSDLRLDNTGILRCNGKIAAEHLPHEDVRLDLDPTYGAGVQQQIFWKFSNRILWASYSSLDPDPMIPGSYLGIGFDANGDFIVGPFSEAARFSEIVETGFVEEQPSSPAISTTVLTSMTGNTATVTTAALSTTTDASVTTVSGTNESGSASASALTMSTLNTDTSVSGAVSATTGASSIASTSGSGIATMTTETASGSASPSSQPTGATSSTVATATSTVSSNGNTAPSSALTSSASQTAAAGGPTLVTSSTSLFSSSSTMTLPPATSTTSYTLSFSGTPLICLGTVITMAPAATFAPSVITIDSNGIMGCEGKQAYLQRQALPSEGYDVLIYAPPQPANMDILPGYFSLATGSLFAQLSPFMRRRKRQIGPLPLGIGPAQTLVAGPGIAPISGVPNSNSTSSLTTSSTPASTTVNGGSEPVILSPVTVTSTVTLTVSGTTQTIVAVQVFINGLPALSGSGSNPLVPGTGQVTVFVSIGSFLVSVSVGGFLPMTGTIISGVPALGGSAPVIVNVVVLVAPVVVQVNGVAVTSFSTMQGFVIATAGGAGLVQGGAKPVTLINAVPIATIVATQTIVAPSINAGVTVVLAVPVGGVAGVVVPAGVFSASVSAVVTSGRPLLLASRSAGDKIASALLAAVVAFVFASAMG